jgi:peptidoglycan/xylan/chitin deacetylase (PgdA/CDA1 family)
MDRPALVTLTFDDGLRCQFENAVRILDQHGFSATFFLIANSEPIHERQDWRKINWSEQDNQLLRSMVQRGHEIGSHSVTHRLQDDDSRGEAEKSKQWIEDRLEVEIPSYCYPFYHITPSIKNAVISAGYKQARRGPNCSYYPLQSQIDYFEVDCRGIRSQGPENIDGWVRPGFWHVLTFHGIGTQNDGWSPIPVAEFDRQMTQLAKYRDSGAVEVVTFKDAANRLRQSK